jgi:hypothetical protein
LPEAGDVFEEMKQSRIPSEFEIQEDLLEDDQDEHLNRRLPIFDNIKSQQ